MGTGWSRAEFDAARRHVRPSRRADRGDRSHCAVPCGRRATRHRTTVACYPSFDDLRVAATSRRGPIPVWRRRHTSAPTRDRRDHARGRRSTRDVGIGATVTRSRLVGNGARARGIDLERRRLTIVEPRWPPGRRHSTGTHLRRGHRCDRRRGELEPGGDAAVLRARLRPSSAAIAARVERRSTRRAATTATHGRRATTSAGLTAPAPARRLLHVPRRLRVGVRSRVRRRGRRSSRRSTASSSTPSSAARPS